MYLSTHAQWQFVDASTAERTIRIAQVTSAEDPIITFGLVYYKEHWKWFTNVEDVSGVQFSFDSKKFSENWYGLKPNQLLNHIDKIDLSDEFLSKILSAGSLKITTQINEVKSDFTFNLAGSLTVIEEAVQSDWLDFIDLVVEKKKMALNNPHDQPFIDEIFIKVDQMPLFGDCDTKPCSDAALIEYIQGNMKYPESARLNNIQGKVYIRFIIEKDGTVMNPEIIRNIGGGCGKEALKVIETMNEHPFGWQPGRQRGKPVRVLYTVPATFKMEDD